VSVKKLIKEFSKIETLPVEVSSVVDAIRSMGVKDEIYYFWDTNLNPEILRGYIKHDQYPQPDGTEKLVAEITYAKMGHEWERLVCCKELLHVIDPPSERTWKREDVDRLVSKITLPPDMADPFKDGKHTLNDRVAITYAVAMLFPFAARQILMPAYQAKKFTLADIEEIAELPRRYVATVMSETWDEVQKLLEKLNGTS
jgi:hypothetical protein